MKSVVVRVGLLVAMASWSVDASGSLRKRNCAEDVDNSTTVVASTENVFSSNVSSNVYDDASSSSSNVDVVLECPAVGEDPVEVVLAPESLARFLVPSSSSPSLCTLTTSDAAPVARSYDGAPWETTPGPLVGAWTFACASDGSYCDARVVPAGAGALVLASFAAPSRDARAVAARFLERATFGPTAEDVDAFVDAETWISWQTRDAPPTYHRELFRRRVRDPAPFATRAGTPASPCASTARWSAAAFSAADRYATATVESLSSSSPSGRWLWRVEGTPRTETDDVRAEGVGDLREGTTYRVCPSPRGATDDRVGGYLAVYDGVACRRLVGGNPPVSFVETTPPYTLDGVEVTSLGGGQYVSSSETNDGLCDALPDGARAFAYVAVDDDDDDDVPCLDDDGLIVAVARENGRDDVDGCADVAELCDATDDVGAFVRLTCCDTCSDDDDDAPTSSPTIEITFSPSAVACRDDDDALVEAARQQGNEEINGCADVIEFCERDDDVGAFVRLTCCATCAGDTDAPTATPTTSPTDTPTKTPTATPTTSPTAGPTTCRDDDDALVEAARQQGNEDINGCADVVEFCERDTDVGAFVRLTCCASCAGNTETPTTSPTTSPTKNPTAAPIASPSCEDNDEAVAQAAAESGNTDITGCADVVEACARNNAMGRFVRRVCCRTCRNNFRNSRRRRRRRDRELADDDGVWVVSDPRLELLENTPDDPDSGGDRVPLGATCSNAPRSFVNADACRVSDSPDACAAAGRPTDDDAAIDLTDDAIVRLYELTGRHVHAIEGLRPETSPCVVDATSRWERVDDASLCAGDPVADPDTRATLRTLLTNAADDDPPTLRTVVLRDRLAVCDVDATTPVDGDVVAIPTSRRDCWRLVHPHHHDVRDVTVWIAQHPGGPDKIRAFAENGEAALLFPDHHEMWRWNQNEQQFPVLGVRGGSVFYRDLPPQLRTPEVAEEFGIVDDGATGSGVVVCGSHGEVANDDPVTDGDDLYTSRDPNWDFPGAVLRPQKLDVWTTVALTAKDQLRQRVAWALSQLLAVSPDNGLDTKDQTECHLAYYDIFVRHAFGNYYDVLKEVSYSPLMAEMLTYLNSRSTAYNLATFDTITFADENYAREIMQLFTIGTVLLNEDGTPRRDDAGELIDAYDNEHVASFARAWTGFTPSPRRGNVEIFANHHNRVDPLTVVPAWRDAFPKIDLRGGHVGDGYPRCADAPPRRFLRRGAEYRLLGSSPALELRSNPPPDVDVAEKPMVLSDDSGLKRTLCDPDDDGVCRRRDGRVVLDENLSCSDQECVVDDVRSVRVDGTTWYEHVPPPCVRRAFLDDGVATTDRDGTRAVCVDPADAVAAEACCDDADGPDATDRDCAYADERTTRDTAAARCAAVGKTTCAFDRFLPDQCREEASVCCASADDAARFWTTRSCDVLVRVARSGLASLVHRPEGTYDGVGHVLESLRYDAIHEFPVYWEEGSYPTVDDDCGEGLCLAYQNTCICSTVTTETAVFFDAPNDAVDLLSKLFVGSVAPDVFDEGLYQEPYASGDDVTVYLRTGRSFDVDTIFAVAVHGEVRYYKNVRSRVLLTSDLGRPSSSSRFAFRNPPHFVDFADPEANDVHHETEAVLREYFHHPNTAPFLASYFAQRFGVSNPSPRYVRTVASAFATGRYGEFGSGRYGDLAATIAAVLLDPESQSVSLDRGDLATGSLREPLLKLTAVMRSMEYQESGASPLVRLRNVSDRIGQMAHRIPSVFSFFLKEYQTTGPVQDASLVAPEGQQYQAPLITGVLNGLFSLVKYGLVDCDEGFGDRVSCRGIEEGDFARSSGRLVFSPRDDTDPIDDLATLLTAGRLNQDSKELIRSQYQKYADADDEEAGLRLAQQLIITTPEFHSTDTIEFSGEAREDPEPLPPTDKPLKTVVYLFLSGGVDSFNMLVPHSDCVGGKDMYEEYVSVRGQIALSKDELLTIDTNDDQVCNKFGLHPQLPVLQTLYEDEQALFFSNTGVLFEPVTKEDYAIKTTTQLFAHNVMQRETHTVGKDTAGTGVLGRITDILSRNGYNTGSFSVTEDAKVLAGSPQESPPTFFIGRNGPSVLNPNPSDEDMVSIAVQLNNPTTTSSGLFAKTWTDILFEAGIQNELLQEVFQKHTVNTPFPNTNIGQQLEFISTIIMADQTMNMDRLLFNADMGGYDSHADVNTTLTENFGDLNEALDKFVLEMKDQGKWDDTVLIMASDFGRTLTPNGGDGSDHAWGGNYFMIGGGVKGGRILGTYPNDLTVDGPLNIGRGRLIPTTSWDQIYNGISQWVGVDAEADLDAVLPNRENFESLFQDTNLFV